MEKCVCVNFLILEVSENPHSQPVRHMMALLLFHAIQVALIGMVGCFK